jgi:hypothetical protein
MVKGHGIAEITRSELLALAAFLSLVMTWSDVHYVTPCKINLWRRTPAFYALTQNGASPLLHTKKSTAINIVKN